MNDGEQCVDAEPLLARRTVLKFIAGAPLVATFGFLASPLMRYLKPTMKAGDFFQTADLPKAEQSVRFTRSDFPQIWTCLPFMLPVWYAVFNPEGHETRNIPGFIVRTAANEIVAFSRICPYERHQHGHRHILNLLMDTAELHCLAQSKTPVLYCCCDSSTFDLGDHGRVLGGPAPRPLRRIDVTVDGENYIITGLEAGEIV